VKLEWETVAELNLTGFNVYRSISATTNYTLVNQNLIPAEGDALLGTTYTYTDQSLSNGTTYYYRLELARSDSGVELYGPLQVIPGSTGTSEAPLTPTISAIVTTPGGASPQPTLTPTPTLQNNVATPTPGAISTLDPDVTTPTPDITPRETQSITPTMSVFEVSTITPVIVEDTDATQTAIAVALVTNAASITPLVSPIAPPPLTNRDWARIGILIVLGLIWVLLGVWLFYYISRINK
jgi:hypothetical protein